jgi:thiosulfate dehydrogenase
VDSRPEGTRKETANIRKAARIAAGIIGVCLLFVGVAEIIEARAKTSFAPMAPVTAFGLALFVLYGASLFRSYKWERPAAVPQARFVALLVLAAACGGGKPVAVVRAPPNGSVHMAAPAESTLRDDPFSASARRGRALVSATRDSLPHNVGDRLRCVSCHLDAGTRAFAMPWVGVYGRFPQYRSRSGRVARLEDRINDCFRRSLNGEPLVAAGDDMRDIVAYISWLSRGSVAGRREPGSGIDSIGPLQPDTASGRTSYLLTCARCHGVNGGGLVTTLASTSGPPLWGPESFSIGAGMARIRVAAAFVHRHMPFDLPGTVSEQTAFDIAGFITTRERPDFAGKELDWPNGDPPPDVAYRTRATNKK